MKRRVERYARKAIVMCPRCGKKQVVLASNSKFMIMCPRCGAGMREQEIRARFKE